MKKYVSLLTLLITITCCKNPESRTWIIPVTINPSDLTYTPAQMESYENRRSRTMDSMEGGFVVLKSSDQESNNRHEFRPNNYFYYLTGYNSPDSYLILEKGNPDPFMLSLPAFSSRKLIYDGGTLPAEEVKEQYGPDRLLAFHELRHALDTLLRSGKPVYTDFRNRDLYEELERISGPGTDTDFRNVAGLLDELRVIKDPQEVMRLQKACNITSEALFRVMKACRQGQYEFEMESVIEGTFLEFGAAMPGFPSIVGSGPNSTILHYEPNNRKMENGDLLLMDIGAEYGYYTADITRTVPVNGKYSSQQHTIYQLVLDAQLAAIEQMQPGNRFLDGHFAARKVMKEGLSKLGLITDPESPWQINFYCLHGSSHLLGMDAHDVGNVGVDYEEAVRNLRGDSIGSRILEPGMVLTIEPGIYFREKGLEEIFQVYKCDADSSEIAAFVEEIGSTYEKYIHIGIRIEDDILITETGNINLSRYAPKEIEDIEQIMR